MNEPRDESPVAQNGQSAAATRRRTASPKRRAQACGTPDWPGRVSWNTSFVGSGVSASGTET